MTTIRQALVVDDNQTNRLIATRLLTKSGWQVAEVDSGEAALAWLAANRAEFVLLDISMPSMSGEEVCRRIRATGLGGDGIKLVAYTAHAMREEQERILGCGFNGILVKPVSRQTLADTLAAVGIA